MTRGSARRVLYAAISIAALGALGACSLLTADDAAQCSTDADCARFAGTMCEASVCRDRPYVADAGVDASLLACSSNQDCTALLHDERVICRAGSCQSLVSHDCGRVLGSVRSDDVVVLGAILPLGGKSAGDWAPVVDALDLAQLDVTSGSVPRPSGAHGAIAVVLCDETINPGRAATHLVNDVGVPAIITRDIPEVLTVAQKASVMTVSPALHVPAATTSALDFQLLPSGAEQAHAILALLTNVIAPGLQTRGPLLLARIHELDPTGDELASVPLALGAGSPPPLDFTIAPSGSPGFDTSYATAVGSLLATSPLPDVIALLGADAMARDVLHALEDGWPPGAPRATYVVSDGLLVPSLLAEVTRDGLSKRLFAIAPAPASADGAMVRDALGVRFRDQSASMSDPRSRGVSAAYDAVYLLAALASATPDPLQGSSLAASFARVSTGPEMRALGDDLGVGLAALASGGSVTFVGASGTMPLLTDTRDLAASFDVLCVAGDPPELSPSGLRYVDGALTGTLSSPCVIAP